MFKKRCKHCNEKIERKFDFCPYCSTPIKNLKNEYGLLGKNDENIGGLMNNKNTSGDSIMDKIIGSAVSSAMKMFERQFQQLEKNENKMSKQPQFDSNLQLYVNGQRIPLPGQKTNKQEANLDEESKEENTKILKKAPKISEETIKKSKNLPRKEAKSKLTRLKDRVVYELDTPGINSLNNVIVNKLENSIEVKAYTEKAVFIKTLKVKLPLISYSMREDKLFLEFKGN
jgi:Mor family transcriptional regulator